VVVTFVILAVIASSFVVVQSLISRKEACLGWRLYMEVLQEASLI
jgi:hypothetical protein